MNVNFDDFRSLRFKEIGNILAPEKGPKRFATFEKRAPELPSGLRGDRRLEENITQFLSLKLHFCSF